MLWRNIIEIFLLSDQTFHFLPFCYCKQVFTSAVCDLCKEVRDLYQWRQITSLDVSGNIERIGIARTEGVFSFVLFISEMVVVYRPGWLFSIIWELKKTYRKRSKCRIVTVHCNEYSNLIRILYIILVSRWIKLAFFY